MEFVWVAPQSRQLVDFWLVGIRATDKERGEGVPENVIELPMGLFVSIVVALFDVPEKIGFNGILI